MRSRFILGLVSLFFSTVAPSVNFEFRDLLALTDLDATTDNGRLGRAIVVNDGFVFAGAPEKDSGTGAVYLFRIDSSGLSLVRELTPVGTSPNGYGRAISSDGEWTAIGYDFGGPVELYRRVGGDWTFFTRIDEPDLGPEISFDNFGNDIDLRGERLIVGDQSADAPMDANVGVAAVFSQNVGGADNWGLEGVLRAPESTEGTFGVAVAIDGNLALVSDGEQQEVHVYKRAASDWNFLTTLQPIGLEPDDGFGDCNNSVNGRCIDIDDDLVAVGAINGNDSSTITNSGSVYLFRRDQGGVENFGQIGEVIGSEPGFIDLFGFSLKLRDGLLFVGSPGAGDNNGYLFADIGFGFEEQALFEPDPALMFGNVRYGTAIGFDQGFLVIGSDSWNDGTLGRVGALFAYELPVLVICGSVDGIFCDGFEN